ncbi:hypothetical protein [Falsirhodobacter halotolerans]|uniref:hypothetical protein n=1 Tax=Falsirhodobacter halotolerans TaxID=1146892 RepID=UPI001FD4B281|nr:hypothetical protein [Falsirhodobacter halotolerans]MCJ8139267.1 hypothetical protein [Falsirhodobacter halotolerans]
MGYIVAAAILALLVIGFTRRTVAVMAGLVALMFASVAIYLAHQRAAQRDVADRNARLVTEVVFDTTCPPLTPLRLILDNTSGLRLDAVTFDLAGYREGYSVPLYRSRDVFSDRIVPAGAVWADCHPLPEAIRGTDVTPLAENPPETLVWTVQNLRGTFGQ